MTPDARVKTHFVLIDCVGVSESPMNDARPLERKKFISFKKLLQHVNHGGADPEMVSSLASRLARLDRQLGPPERERVAAISDGSSVRQITRGIVDALDADAHVERARERFEVPPEAEPSEEQVETASREMIREAVTPLANNPRLRKLIRELKQQFDQIIDEISQDELLEAAPAPQVREKARELVRSFEHYLEEHKEEIDALQFFYSQPYASRLRYDDIRALVDAIGAPPRNWTPDRLWRAYEQLDESRVRGASSERLLTDVVSLVRFALHRDEELVPYGEQVRHRFEVWLAQQGTAGREFSEEQLRWLGMIRDHVAQSLEIEVEDFDLTPFVEEGGLGKAGEVFGEEFAGLIQELNEVLAA